MDMMEETSCLSFSLIKITLFCWSFICIVVTVLNETVSVKTFKKWPFASHFEAKVDEENQISSLKCVICSD